MAEVEFTINVLEPPFNMPELSVISPLNVWVSPVPKCNIPPVPLMVNIVALTLLCKVAVPAVLVILTVPVVTNPDRL